MPIMLLVQLLVLILVAGIVWYVIGVLPIPQPFKNAGLVVIALILILFLLSAAGLLRL